MDLHGDALEAAIAAKAVDAQAEFIHTVRRLEILAEWISTRIAQAAWLRAWPSEPAPPAPLSCQLGRHRIPIRPVLAALRDLQLDGQLIAAGSRHTRQDRRRGASRSMAALNDAGASASDVAYQLDISPSRAWAILNGHQPAPPGLPEALQRLVGQDHAELVLQGIPAQPRARARQNPAVQALHAAGATVDDIAALIPAQPGTVRRWLRGMSRPSAKLKPAL